MDQTPPTRACAHCGGEFLEFSPENLIWWCAECGAPNTSGQVEGTEEADFLTCDHCGQDMDFDTDGQECHVVDLEAPSCPKHKAEVVARRRAKMRLVQGGGG